MGKLTSQPLSPLDYASPRAGDSPGMLLRVVGRVGWPLVVCVALVSAVTLWIERKPSASFPEWLLLLLTWGIAGAIAIIQLGTILFLHFKPHVRNHPITNWHREIMLVGIIAATIALVELRIPLRVAIWFSASDIRRLAPIAAKTPPNQFLPNQKIGAFSATEIAPVPGGGLRFIVKDTGFLNRDGIVYSPSGPPNRIGDDSYRHLTGPWYLWHERF